HTNRMSKTIKVIDLFAGPGGLGEGFSAFTIKGKRPFKIAVAIEKEASAQQTLLLRSFFRRFESEPVPDEYYDLLSDTSRKIEVRLKELYDQYPEQYKEAQNEALLETLG